MIQRLAPLVFALFLSDFALARQSNSALEFSIKIESVTLHYSSRSLYHGALGLGWCTSFEWPCQNELPEDQKRALQTQFAEIFEFERDSLHLLKIKNPQNQVSFQYDEVSNLTLMTSLRTQRHFFYTKDDQFLGSEIQPLNGGLR
jgi:hypothetical protein